MFIKMFLGMLLAVSYTFAAKVGLCITATGKYIQFVDPLVVSAERYFCTNHDVTYFVFTDSPLESTDKIKYFHQSKLGWPFDTMMRFQAHDMHRKELATQDFLFALDADMLFVDEMGDEILSERVATAHPGYYASSRRAFTYESSPLSTAYIGSKEGHKYFAGGFYGGSSQEFLKIAETCLKNIYADLGNGMIAVWHDESHWNRYCVDHPPTLILSPAYCYPESWNLPFPKKLLALDKNHQEIRK